MGIEDEIKWTLPNRICRWRATSLLTKEPETIEWIDSFGEDDAVLYDVGANVGVYTLYAAVKHGLTVHAFEPESLNFSILNQNIKLNSLSGQVTAYPLALGLADGISTLHLSSFDFGNSLHTLGGDVDFNNRPRRSAHIQGTYSITIDQMLSLEQSPCHIKIDVDGLENEIIMGATSLGKKSNVKSIMIELNTNLLDHRAVPIILGEFGFNLKGAWPVPSGRFKGIGNHLFVRN